MSDRPRREPPEPDEDQPVPEQQPGVDEDEDEAEDMPHVPDESNLPGGQPTGPG